jgi:hypothetical protein
VDKRDPQPSTLKRWERVRAQEEVAWHGMDVVGDQRLPLHRSVTHQQHLPAPNLSALSISGFGFSVWDLGLGFRFRQHLSAPKTLGFRVEARSEACYLCGARSQPRDPTAPTLCVLRERSQRRQARLQMQCKPLNPQPSTLKLKP